MREVAKKVKLLKKIDVDKIQIKRDHYFSNAYVIDLPLDSLPDHVWLDIFEREWKSSRHLWDRKLFVMGDVLRLVTPLNGIEEKLDWVARILDRTNSGIEQYNKEFSALEVEVAERARKQILEEEKANIEIIKAILRKRLSAL